MLAGVEIRLAALIGDGLAARTHTRVVRTPVPAPDPGKGSVLVTLAGIQEDPSFQPGLLSIGQGDQQKAPVRRVVSVILNAQMDVTVTPPTADAAGAAAARDLALDDVATVVYVLHQDDVYSGKAFVPSDPDPGFEVHSFAFDKMTMDGASAAHLFFSGRADVWPAGSATDGGKITNIDPLLAALPLHIELDRESLPPGGSTTVRVPSFAPTRLALNGQRGLASLAVSVMSDAPIAQRGTIPEGAAGPETGLRIVPLARPATLFSYHAPAANAGPARWEYIQVHLATADLRRGALLGTAAVRITEGA
jgi:hypothetical protein